MSIDPSSLLKTLSPVPDPKMNIFKHAPGAVPADPTKLSFAYLPYEIQTAIWEAAGSEPQITFMDIFFNNLKFTRPAESSLSGVCQLSRQIYVRDRQFCQFGKQKFYVDPDRDIFYLRHDDPLPSNNRPQNSRDLPPLPGGDRFDCKAVRNVGIDFRHMGTNPRRDTIIRLWSIFPAMKALHIMVPQGGLPRHDLTGEIKWTPGNMLLRSMPSSQVIASPGTRDKELWLALRYQVKRMCGKILEVENGWMGREVPQVYGHFSTMLGVEGAEGVEEVVEEKVRVCCAVKEVRTVVTENVVVGNVVVEEVDEDEEDEEDEDDEEEEDEGYYESSEYDEGDYSDDEDLDDVDEGYSGEEGGYARDEVEDSPMELGGSVEIQGDQSVL